MLDHEQLKTKHCLTAFVTFLACVRADDMNTEILIATVANRW